MKKSGDLFSENELNYVIDWYFDDFFKFKTRPNASEVKSFYNKNFVLKFVTERTINSIIGLRLTIETILGIYSPKKFTINKKIISLIDWKLIKIIGLNIEGFKQKYENQSWWTNNLKKPNPFPLEQLEYTVNWYFDNFYFNNKRPNQKQIRDFYWDDFNCKFIEKRNLLSIVSTINTIESILGFYNFGKGSHILRNLVNQKLELLKNKK